MTATGWFLVSVCAFFLLGVIIDWIWGSDEFD